MHIAPCPFCDDGGAPHPYFNQIEQLTMTVQCGKCRARGPWVKIDNTNPKRTWDEIIAGPKEEAIRKWNHYFYLQTGVEYEEHMKNVERYREACIEWMNELRAKGLTEET